MRLCTYETRLRGLGWGWFRLAVLRLEEGGGVRTEGVDQQRAVQIAVTALAGGLGGEETGVAGGAHPQAGTRGDSFPVGLVVSAEGIGGAQTHLLERLVEMPRERLPLAETYQAAH